MVSFISNLDKVFCKKSLKSLVLTAAMISTLGFHGANAQTVGPGCDPKFMAAMQQKGWMEAQREIMIAQTTIAKPDSVFALGCFGKFANDFSGTTTFGNGNNFNYSSTITQYVSSAFGHKYGGGHYTSSGMNNGANTNCGEMADLWDKARGANLTLPSRSLDTLQDIATYNRDSFPNPAPTLPPYGAVGTPSSPLGKFYGPKTKDYALGDASSGSKFDDMKLFSNVTAPLSQTADPTATPAVPEKCAAGIPTGLSTGTPAKPEVVCPNPGCVSDGTGSYSSATPPVATYPKCCDYKSPADHCSS